MKCLECNFPTESGYGLCPECIDRFGSPCSCKVNKIIGKRCIVTKGTRLGRSINRNGQYISDDDYDGDYSSVQMWIAGDILIGTIGTIVYYSHSMCQIIWDDKRSPKDGYSWCIDQFNNSIQHFKEV